MIKNLFKLGDVVVIKKEVQNNEAGYGLVGEVGRICSVKEFNGLICYDILPSGSTVVKLSKFYYIPENCIELLDESSPDNLNRTRLSNDAKKFFRKNGMTTAYSIFKFLVNKENREKMPFDYKAIESAISPSLVKVGIIPPTLFDYSLHELLEKPRFAQGN